MFTFIAELFLSCLSIIVTKSQWNWNMIEQRWEFDLLLHVSQLLVHIVSVRQERKDTLQVMWQKVFIDIDLHTTTIRVRIFKTLDTCDMNTNHFKERKSLRSSLKGYK